MYILLFQNATLSITETLTDKLKNLSDSDKGFENIKLISKNVLKTLGGLTSGLISSGNASASSNPSDEKVYLAVLNGIVFRSIAVAAKDR